LLGHPIIQTPNLDRLAARGALFENAFCCSPLCVPSRVGFFTGQYVHRTNCTGFEPEHHISDWSFLNELKREGDVLGLSGKNHAFHDDYLAEHFSYREEYAHWGKSRGDIRDADRDISRWMTTAGPGNRTPEGRLMEGLVGSPLPFAQEQCPTWRIAEDAIGFVSANKNQPFFLHCSFPEPHFPNTVCEPYYSMYSSDRVELEATDINWSGHPFAHYVQSQSSGYDAYSDEERREILSIYLGQITLIDKAIGALLDSIRHSGIEDCTIVVFASDHGDFGGRFGLVGKTKAFYEPLIRIPLIVAIPGRPDGQRISASVSNIDVMPTIADFLGLGSTDRVQGKSFLPLIDGNTQTHRDTIYAEVGTPEPPPPPMPIAEFPTYNSKRKARDGVFWFIEYTTRGRAAMIRKDNWKYCFYTGDTDELYNIADDPLELHNLADVSEHSARKEQLRAALLEWTLSAPVTFGQAK
jgi:arylsulfatase A-like enzyme